MSDRRPIDAEYHAGGPGEGSEDGEDAVDEEMFKEALSYHATGVTIVAIRDGPTIHATTVSSFMPVSVEPPVIVFSVGGNAQVLPFLDEGTTFVVNLLGADQRRLATVYADSYPVGPSPFASEGAPVIEGALASLRCRVESVIEVAHTRVVLGRVAGTEVGGGGDALVHYRRDYHALS